MQFACVFIPLMIMILILWLIGFFIVIPERNFEFYDNVIYSIQLFFMGIISFSFVITDYRLYKLIKKVNENEYLKIDKRRFKIEEFKVVLFPKFSHTIVLSIILSFILLFIGDFILSPIGNYEFYDYFAYPIQLYIISIILFLLALTSYNLLQLRKKINENKYLKIDKKQVQRKESNIIIKFAYFFAPLIILALIVLIIRVFIVNTISNYKLHDFTNLIIFFAFITTLISIAIIIYKLILIERRKVDKKEYQKIDEMQFKREEKKLFKRFIYILIPLMIIILILSLIDFFIVIPARNFELSDFIDSITLLIFEGIFISVLISIYKSRKLYIKKVDKN